MRGAIEAINARDWHRFDEAHAEAVVAYSTGLPEPTKGRAAHREFVQRLLTAFPDLRIEEVRSFGQGDWVCGEFVAKGTHGGPLAGPGGRTIPATGKVGQLQMVGLAKIEGGQIVEERNCIDLLGLLTQLGALPGGP